MESTGPPPRAEGGGDAGPPTYGERPPTARTLTLQLLLEWVPPDAGEEDLQRWALQGQVSGWFERVPFIGEHVPVLPPHNIEFPVTRVRWRAQASPVLVLGPARHTVDPSWLVEALLQAGWSADLDTA